MLAVAIDIVASTRGVSIAAAVRNAAVPTTRSKTLGMRSSLV
jgi:hypothetical protein